MFAWDLRSSLTSRQVTFLVLAGITVVLLFNILGQRGSISKDEALEPTRPHRPVLQPPVEPHLKVDPNGLTFGNARADNDVVDGLSSEQCSSLFSELYTEIDSTVDYWKQELGYTIQARDLDFEARDAAMRILIHDNSLRILNCTHAVDKMQASPDRALGVVYLLQRALDSAIAAGDKIPTIEVTLNFRDDAEPPKDPNDRHAFWSFARTIGDAAHKRLFLMPNFDFWYYSATGGFFDAKRNAMQYDAPFVSKIPKVVWRGNAGFNPGVRGSLLEYAKDKDWSDIKDVHFDEDPPISLDVDQFCRYAMTVYTEGVTYSGRLKFLMNCESLLISHEPAYATHYSHLLVPEGAQQNYVLVKRDWSDLDAKVKYYLENPKESERIIANNLATFRSRYTTRAANSCYLRRLMHSYATVAFTPDPYRPMKDGSGKRLRGISFEQFIDYPQDKNYELD